MRNNLNLGVTNKSRFNSTTTNNAYFKIPYIPITTNKYLNSQQSTSSTTSGTTTPTTQKQEILLNLLPSATPSANKLNRRSQVEKKIKFK